MIRLLSLNKSKLFIVLITHQPIFVEQNTKFIMFPSMTECFVFSQSSYIQGRMCVNCDLDRSCPWFIYCRFLWRKWRYWPFLLLLQIAKSLWARRSPREIEIDTCRLYEQFGVKDLGHYSNSESSNHAEILLNAKIAHNFSEYWSYDIKTLLCCAKLDLNICLIYIKIYE